MDNFHTINNFADILSFKYLIDNGDIKGDFVEYNNNLYFKEVRKKTIFGYPKNNEDKDKFKKFSWIDILKKYTLNNTEENKIADEIIILTTDKSILLEIIKKHYLIQRGEISYSKVDEIWLIKIKYPSIWAISLLQGKYAVFNKSNILENIYFEKGVEIKELAHLKQTHQIIIPQNQYTFIYKNGITKTFKIEWKNSDTAIELKNSNRKIYKSDEDFKIEIEPKLINSYHKKLSNLWFIDDMDKLKRIVTNYGSESITSLKAWFSENDTAYIISFNINNDSGLTALFNESFKSFYKHRDKMFFPSGLTLMPLIDEIRLYEIYDINKTDYVIFMNENDKLSLTILPEKDIKPLSSFIIYRTEKTVNQLESFNSQWKFNFGEIKKKSQIIYIKPDNIEDLVFNNKNKKSKKEKQISSKSVFNKEKRTINDSEWEKLRNRVYLIDNELLDNIINTELWLERSQISEYFDNKISSLISKLTIDIINRDNKNFIKNLEEYIKQNENSDFIKNINDNDENSKGKVLLDIRNKKSVAEIDFSYQLYYANKFNDKDVFDYAVNSMLKGYSNTIKGFHDFEEKSFGKLHNDFDSLNNENTENIKNNINNFINVIENFNPEYKNIVLKQLKIMIDSNIPFNTDNLVYIEDISYTDSNLKELDNLLKNYPALPQNYDKATEKWFSTIEMKNIKSVDIKDFFTGEIYRSSFASDFNAIEESQKIYSRYIDGEILNESDEINNIKSELDPKKRAEIKGQLFNRVFRFKGKSSLDAPKSQRILLHIITEHKPLKDFQKLTLDPVYNDSFYNTIVMNCDIFRINLAYRIKIDESFFFENMIESISKPYVLFIDFKDAVENIILCLFISQNSRRKEFLNIILKKCMEWFTHLENVRFMKEILTTISLIQAGILLDDIPDSISEYNFRSRKNSLWIEYASYLRNNYNEFLEK